MSDRQGEWPDVDVVMPVRNEAVHLEAAVAAVRSQEYPGKLRIFLGVGPSDDSTEQVAADLARQDEAVQVIDNPDGRTPSALNRAIRAGTAPVVVRVDGHSELSNGYIRRAVETLRRTGAVNVGGRQIPVAVTPFERAVAAATTSRLGTGGASYRVGGSEGPVDTVYLGVFDRVAIEQVGLFDERLIRNQDYELNIRLRQAGGTVWFDPELSVGYRPRGSWRALTRQYYEYGYWKSIVMRMHPASTRLRQLMPPAATAVVTATTLASIRDRRLSVVPVGAVVITAAEARRAGRRTSAPWTSGFVVLATIPLAWSAGFARGLVDAISHLRAPGTDSV